MLSERKKQDQKKKFTKYDDEAVVDEREEALHTHRSKDKISISTTLCHGIGENIDRKIHK